MAKISSANTPSKSLFTERLGFTLAKAVPAFQEVHLVRRVEVSSEAPVIVEDFPPPPWEGGVRRADSELLRSDAACAVEGCGNAVRTPTSTATMRVVELQWWGCEELDGEEADAVRGKEVTELNKRST